MNDLLVELHAKGSSLSVSGVFVGGAAHADDVRTTASSTSVLHEQMEIINQFTSRNMLCLNTSKTEVVRFSKSVDSLCLTLNDHEVQIQQ